MLSTSSQNVTLSDAMFLSHLNGVLDERERNLKTIVGLPSSDYDTVDLFKDKLIDVIKNGEKK